VVEKSEMLDWGREIHYRVEASHFLWKMVRRLAGTLIEVGRGNLDLAAIEKLLTERSTAPAKWTAPPSGLFLESVRYGA
jgi:tRNA pseudouridine38-40 synthase